MHSMQVIINDNFDTYVKVAVLYHLFYLVRIMLSIFALLVVGHLPHGLVLN